MKKSICSIGLAVLLTLTHTSYAQQNKPVSDTAGLRSEYASLYNDITGLNQQLNTVKGDLATYLSQTKNGNTATGAANQASPSDNGKNIPAAEESKKDYENASQAENRRLNSLHDRIYILASEISKKKQRLQQLSAPEIL